MQKVLIIFFTILVTLGMSELGLRLLWYNPYRHESPDRLLKIRTLPSNKERTYSRAFLDPENPQVKLRTDARSYILPSFQYSNPAATIAFLGGSTTECSAVQEDMRFPALVSRLLAEQGLKVNTLNAAQSGNTLHDSLNILLNHVVYDRPDIVVLMHASNDIATLVRDGGYQSRSGYPVSVKNLVGWSLQIASSNIYLAALARRSAKSWVISSPTPGKNVRDDSSLIHKTLADMYRQRLKAFVNVCRAFGIQPVLMTQPASRSTNSLTPAWIDFTNQDHFNAIIRAVGEEEAVPVIDLVNHLKKRDSDWDKPMKIFYDGIHVTDKGSQVYAQHITEHLLPLIRVRASIEDGSGSPSVNPGAQIFK